MTFRVTPPRAVYADAPALQSYYDTLIARLSVLPGVTGIGAVSGVPLGSSNTIRGVIRQGDPLPERGHARLALYQVATPGYFAALGARLTGRDFTAADSSSSEPVTIINQAMADELWPQQNAIGQSILVHTDEQTPRRVVGVIGTIRQTGLDEEVSGQYFVPMAQAPQRSLSVVLRVVAGVDASRVRETARGVDPSLPLYDVRTLEQVMGQSLAQRRAMTTIVSAFGLIALVLATIGVYGVVSTGVSERRRELGIRLALGASRARVLQLVLRQAMTLTVVGLVIGLGASAAGAQVVSEFVFGVEPMDYVTRGWVVLLLMMTTLAASLSPARRAARVDPAISLRADA